MGGEGDLEVFRGNFNIPIDGWEKSPFITVREASQKFNPSNEFCAGFCSCKMKCQSSRCSCRQMGATCSSKCHKGMACANTASELHESEDGSQKQKKVSKSKLSRRSQVNHKRPMMSQSRMSLRTNQHQESSPPSKKMKHDEMMKAFLGSHKKISQL